MENNGYLSPEELQALGSKDVQIGTGHKVRIRRLSPSALMQSLGSLVELSKFDAQEVRREIESGGKVKADKAFEAIGRVLLAGVLQPRLVADPTQGPVASDFDMDDQVLLFGEILALSGLNREKAAAVRP